MPFITRLNLTLLKGDLTTMDHGYMVIHHLFFPDMGWSLLLVLVISRSAGSSETRYSQEKLV